MKLVLLNDTLRLHDNPLLTTDTQPAAAVVVLDKAAFFGTQYGVARANLMRLQQQLYVISTLKQALHKHNIGLITLVGDIASSVRTVAAALNATTLCCAEPVATFEYAALAQLSAALNVSMLDCNSLLGDTLRPDLNNVPDTFTPFRQQQEPLMQVSSPLSMPMQPANWLTPAHAERYNTEFTALVQQYLPTQYPLLPCRPADEHTVLQHVARYIWHNQHILHYKATRNQLLGDNYASFCSSALALGSLSVRWLWQQIVQFEQQIAANESTYWLKFELLWREFFRWQFRKHNGRWFSKNAIKGERDFAPPHLSATKKTAFINWCSANTGDAFIDANMRLLHQTGLMSNRGRQNVASYLVHDLGVDWRLGAAYFEQRLCDYSCASNWGNWAYIAGVGNSTARRFNVQKQAQCYDSDGYFVQAMLKR